MNKYNLYRNLCYVGGISLLILVILNLINPFDSEYYDLVRDILIIATLMFAYFWQRKVLLLIGLIALMIDFNIGLFSYSILPNYNPDFSNSVLKTISNIFIFIGFICFIVGFWKISDKRFFNMKSKVGIFKTSLSFLIITGLIQFIIRKFYE